MNTTNNTELIKALQTDIREVEDDPVKTLSLMWRAAAALEAANKTVTPHRNYKNCAIWWCDCGWFLRNKDQAPNYCPNCGKIIEWGDAE